LLQRHFVTGNVSLRRFFVTGDVVFIDICIEMWFKGRLFVCAPLIYIVQNSFSSFLLSLHNDIGQAGFLQKCYTILRACYTILPVNLFSSSLLMPCFSTSYWPTCHVSVHPIGPPGQLIAFIHAEDHYWNGSALSTVKNFYLYSNVECNFLKVFYSKILSYLS
jgi:hypothetical protein